jgi:ATP/maltotriose-dependent transcriptional regulator MalT
MMQARDIWLRKRGLFLIPVTDVWAARETARRGDRDAGIPVLRQAVDELRQAGNIFYGVWGAGVLVETLLERGAEGDVAEAQEEFDRLANLRADQDSAMRDIWLLRLRVLLCRARGDEMGYRDYRDRYRAMAKSLGFECHIDWAEAMIEGT